MPLRISLFTFPVHASMHFTVCSRAKEYKIATRFTLYFPYACLYAFHSLLSLCMPLCISLSTFPEHASMHFTVYSHYDMPLSLSTFPSAVQNISLRTFPMHFHCVLSLGSRIVQNATTLPEEPFAMLSGNNKFLYTTSGGGGVRNTKSKRVVSGRSCAQPACPDICTNNSPAQG